VPSLIAGVFITTAFALGARFITIGSDDDSDRRPHGGMFVLAALSILIVAAAIAYGRYFTIDESGRSRHERS
jgi:hypothetical protein